MLPAMSEQKINRKGGLLVRDNGEKKIVATQNGRQNEGKFSIH